MSEHFTVSRALVLATIATLAACRSEPSRQQESTPGGRVESSAQGPDARPGIALSGARLVLPAVRGNPGAVYFTLANGGGAAVTIAAVALDGAGRAEMHETVAGRMAALPGVAVPARGKVVFAPGGKHVMAFDLATSLVARGQTELTLTFVGGDKVSAPVAIQAAGSADAMAGMTMTGG